MSVTINISQVASDLLRELIKVMGPLFIDAGKNSTQFVRDIIREELYNSPEYYAMIPGGELYHEIGNPEIESDLAKIIGTLIQNIEVIVKPPSLINNTIEASYEIRAIRSDFADILDLKESSFFTEKGRLLRWLSWMLLEGDNEIITGFMFIGGHEERSRTNYGIMVPGFGASWGIHQYGGVANDNWLTRASERILPELVREIENNFRKVF